MQAIITKILPATNYKPTRIKASCQRGSVTISDPIDFKRENSHIHAADCLVKKFVQEDEKKYGTFENPWLRKRVCGELPNGDFAHVFID